MINTIKEINDKLQAFVNLSAIVNEYQSGDFSTFNSADHKYPLIYMTPLKFRIQSGMVQFVVNIAVMDLIYDKNDLIKVLSDLGIILTELFIYLTDDAENQQYFITLASVSEFQPWFRGIDNTCGFQGDVTFNLAGNMSILNVRMK
jgi:hypothetical protein